MNIMEKKRIRLGLTQQQLAEIIGVDRTTIGKWELGKAVPRIKRILVLTKILDCSIEDIYSCQNNINNSIPARYN